ncbi:hypothetical protein FHS43_005288 [Streptosporangium becharense]|uniref:DNA-directed RNA polymerase specialized sigma subunit, sigma24 family n=1 Tax=Streptosporangium becharense TaxID=1816182 RepID=A0A7W9IJ34_9ACTN|nr:hypothetical protein [Streptosporangium becharense]MBB2913979.1 hypothetical protein [Streptosporangium becharense]MBB5821360.1 hypothetical protein [Streptosporangium becharense]
MTQQLLGQRSRGELIAELYDRHAAGLFAYCHDQLGDAGSAAEVLAAVFSGVQAVEPPRAALYALARREIYLRDIVYCPPRTDLDPAVAFVDRVLREMRPHQREVLYLSGVRELDTAELSWVLDVAADTADELTVSACRGFARSLTTALAATRIPDPLREVFGALTVAPVRDVLNLAPWATPPAGLRAVVLGPQAAPVITARRSPSPRVKQLWPTTPAWPVPDTGGTAPRDATASPAPGAGGAASESPAAFPETAAFPEPATEDRFPDPFAPPNPDEVSAHEASTEPMPKLRGPMLDALDEAAVRPRRRRPQRPRPRGERPMSAPVPGDVLDDFAPHDDLLHPPSPRTRAIRPHTDRLVAAAPRDKVASPPGEAASPPDRAASPPGEAASPPGEAASSRDGSAPPDGETAPPRDEIAPPRDEAAAPSPATALDAPPSALPLPGWPLQTDQLDALAERERESERERKQDRAPLDLPRPVGLPESLNLPRPVGPSESLNLPRPVGLPDPVSPSRPAEQRDHSSVSGAQDPAPGTAHGTRPGTAQPSPPVSAAGRSPLRLPRWVMRDDLVDEPPSHSPTPHGLAPHSPTPPDLAPHSGSWDGTEAGPAPVPGIESTSPPPAGVEVSPAALSTPATPPPAPPTAPARAGGRGRATSGRRAAASGGRAASPRRASHRARRKHRAKARHHDWAWELIGFLIAVTIAMIVFFAVPMIITP